MLSRLDMLSRTVQKVTSQWLSESLIVSDLEIAIASPSFASLLLLTYKEQRKRLVTFQTSNQRNADTCPD